MKNDQDNPIVGRSVIWVFSIFAIVSICLFLFNLSRPPGEPLRSIDQLGGSFTLTTSNRSFSLSDIAGKVGILYFGFTNCEEACPASLEVFRSAYQQLTDYERKKVQFVYISVDPERDNNQQLSDFCGAYENKIVAFTGTQEQIDTLTKQYGVYFDIEDFEGNTDDYVVDHSSRFYLIDHQGILVRSMSHSTTPTELATRLLQMIQRIPIEINIP